MINGRNGRILSATPLRTASRMPPGAPSGVTMGEWQRMPPGYTPPPGTVPQPGYGPGAPTADDEDDDAPQQPGAYGARPPAPVQGAPPRYGNNPPRDYNGGQPGDEADAQPQSDPQVIPADPQGGPLPPPPERFPQRAAPPAAQAAEARRGSAAEDRAAAEAEAQRARRCAFDVDAARGRDERMARFFSAQLRSAEISGAGQDAGPGRDADLTK